MIFRNNTSGLLITVIFCSLTSCETRTVKYSGLNDMVFGMHSVFLYTNGDFYLELGAGGVDGTYLISNDTVNLQYDSKPDDWPDQLLISDDYIETIPTGQHTRSIRIRRNEKTLTQQ